MDPASARSTTPRIRVGMRIARELERRCSGGSTFADGARRGHAPASAVAYGSALRERSFSTGLTAGVGRKFFRGRGAGAGGRPNAPPAGPGGGGGGRL